MEKNQAFQKLKARREFWNKIADHEGKKKNEIEITEKILNSYLRSKDLQRENQKLKKLAQKRANIISVLSNAVSREEKRCIKLIRANENLEKSMKNKESKHHSLQKEYYTLQKEYQGLLDNPKIEEKVIYKTDTVTLRALRKKRDKLQGTLNQVRNERDELLKKIREMEKESKSIDQWKKEKYALLITELYKFSRLTESPLNMKNIQVLDSKNYYLWRGEREMFEKELEIQKPYVVLPIGY